MLTEYQRITALSHAQCARRVHRTHTCSLSMRETVFKAYTPPNEEQQDCPRVVHTVHVSVHRTLECSPSIRGSHLSATHYVHGVFTEHTLAPRAWKRASPKHACHAREAQHSCHVPIVHRTTAPRRSCTCVFPSCHRRQGEHNCSLLSAHGAIGGTLQPSHDDL